MTHKTPQEGERETRTLAWIVDETISLRALACTSRLWRLSNLQRQIFWLEDEFKGFGSSVLVLFCCLKKIWHGTKLLDGVFSFFELGMPHHHLSLF
jgi:hypothetical protein